MGSRYIDAKTIPDLFNKKFKETQKLIAAGETQLDNLAEGFAEAEKIVLFKAPAADVQEVRRGKWISNDLGGYKWAFHCSLCGFVDGYPFNDRFNFCPHCGAKMEASR